MATMATAGIRQILRVSQVVANRGLSSSAVVCKASKFNDPFEHATGIEKWELTRQKEGNNDPFFMNMQSRGKGTKAEPNIIESMDTYRAIGCSCNENDTNIKWMWVQEGTPKRCACGYWFKLRVNPAPSKENLPL